MAWRASRLLAALAAIALAGAAPPGPAQVRPHAAAGKARPARTPPAAETPPPHPGVRLAPSQTLPPAELEAFVDGLAAEAMSRDHIAGAVVTVVQDGQVLLDQGYGVDRFSPVRPVDPDRTLFRLGPITETFTWIGVLREVEAGHMRLDAPIDQYLRQSDQIPDQNFVQPVRLKDLLSQGPGFEERRFGQIVERDPTLIRPLETYLAQERPRRVREPGQIATYTPYAAALAGEALSQVAGKTPQALAEAEVFQPLGLSRTTLREPYPTTPGLPAPMDPRLAADVSQGFRWTGSGLMPQPPEFSTQAAPALAGSSTGADMARYLMAILGDGTLNGRIIYSPAIAKDFRTPLLQPAPGVRAWDYGMLEYPLPGGYAGYGRDGGALNFRAELLTAPQLRLGFFVAANTQTAGGFVRSIPVDVVQRFYARTAPPTPGSPWLQDNASAFQGSFLTTGRAYRGLEGFVDRFRGRARLSVSKTGFLMTSGAGGRERWTPDAAASADAPYVTFHEVDGPGVLVVQMQDGRAQRWFAPSGEAVFERAGFLSHRAPLAGLAAATALAALAALMGLFFRDRRDFRQTSVQARADGAQISASVLWLLALACFGVFYLGASDPAVLVADWPGAWLLIASACALVASLVTVLCLGLLLPAWRGGRRLDSWTLGRKARFTATTLIFALFGALLAVWGALEPWSR
jgi:CubicO group peptidase (beta-lactamase class C family)